MPLITDYHQVKDTYQEAAELGVALPVFGTEDRETLGSYPRLRVGARERDRRG